MRYENELRSIGSIAHKGGKENLSIRPVSWVAHSNTDPRRRKWVEMHYFNFPFCNIEELPYFLTSEAVQLVKHACLQMLLS
jgi:hypothetical protein